MFQTLLPKGFNTLAYFRWISALLLCAGCQGAWATPAFEHALSTLKAKREACEHWQGEEGYDAERQADIAWSICHACLAADRDLAQLKHRYRQHPQQTKALTAFKPFVPHAQRQAFKAQCQHTRKPAWQP